LKDARKLVVVGQFPSLKPLSQSARHFTGLTNSRAEPDFLAASLAYQLGTTVVNKTGIQGNFSYHLEWNPDDPRPGIDSEQEKLSLFTAIREQLGLKLESRKGEVEVLIVDYVEQPSEN
jgi:uncharacterized protein (TIGR03435 family)